MNLTEPGEKCEEGGPYTDEEDEDFPVDEVSAPQVGRVLFVRGGLVSTR